jgi:hypothetical protein
MPGCYLIGGGFQDCEGNILVNSRLTMELSAPATDLATGTIQLCPGEVVSVQLDYNGNVNGAQPIWPNNLLYPANTYYKVIVYTSNGQLAWGPNSISVIGVGDYVYLSSWVPGNPS